jgi:multiple RNA-binding domain-containing protein 1
MLHILPGKEKPAESAETTVENQPGMSIFQKKRETDRKTQAGKATHSWNTLFMGANVVAETLAEKLQIKKADFLEGDELNRYLFVILTRVPRFVPKKKE